MIVDALVGGGHHSLLNSDVKQIADERQTDIDRTRALGGGTTASSVRRSGVELARNKHSPSGVVLPNTPTLGLGLRDIRASRCRTAG